MARKRLNIKFLVLGVTAFLLLGAAATVYKFRKRLFYGSPAEMVAQAKQLMEQGKYDEAGAKLYDAGSMDRGNPEIYILLGDVWDKKAGEDPHNNIQKAGGYWQSALSIDPRYLPALQRLLARSTEFVEINPRAQSFVGLRDTAQKVLVADPEDKKAQYALHMATIQLQRVGGEIDQAAVDDSVKALQKMLADDPSHAEAMYQIASNKLRRAGEAYRAGDDASARNHLAEVVALAEQSIKEQPQNATMMFRAGLAFQEVGEIERLIKGDVATWEQRAIDTIARARELAKPEDPRYVETHLVYGRMLAYRKKPAEAEAVYRDLMKNETKDIRARVALARQLTADPKRQEEAMRLLAEPLPPAKEQAGLTAYMVRQSEVETLLLLLDIKLDRLGLNKTPEDRQRAMAEIEADFAKLKSLHGERPDAMQVQARIQLSKGDIAGAVQTLSASLRSAEWQSDQTRMRSMEMLARAYVLTNQTGQAKRTLGDLIRAMDGFPNGESFTVATRMLLIELLLNENNVDEARPHVEIVRKHLPPEDPRNTLLQIIVLDKPEQAAERRKLYDSLPQDSRAQVMDKARLAQRVLKDDDLYVKLMEGLRASEPADVVVVGQLADHYLSKGKKDQAERVVDEAIAKAPDNMQLQMAKKRLAADTPEEAAALREEQVASITDPFRKELRQFELALNKNEIERARAHLAAAEKIKPDDPAVLDYLYRFHASTKENDKAQQYLDRLAQKDPGRGEIERIRFALVKGDTAQALDLAQKLTRDRGEFALSYLMLAEVQQAIGNNPEAITAFKSALERDSRNLDAMRGLINAYYRAGQPNEARRYIETARRVYPNNAQMRELALDHEVQYGDPEQAIAPRQQQLNEDKENPGNWLALGQAYLSAYRAKTNANKDAEAKAHLAKADDTLRQAYAKWPDDERFATGVAQVALRQQKYDEGERALRALAERPTWKERHEPAVFLANYFLAANKKPEAEKVYRDLLDKTKDIGLELQLADLIFQQGRLDDALAVLQLNPEHPAVRRLRVDLLIRGKRLDDAQKELNAMSAGQPPNAVLLDMQAYIHMTAGKSAEAVDAVNKALAVDPKYPLALYRRGLLRLMTRGDADGAIADLTAVRQLAPTLPEPRVQLARAHRAKNDMDTGIRELEAGVRDVPNDKTLRLELVKFYGEAIPPRWGDAERVFREARDIPSLAKDAAILQEEAKMWAARNDMQRAVRVIQEAGQAAPGDATVVRTLLDILNKGKQHKEVISITDRFLKGQPDAWWAYQARGIAKGRMNDKDGALAEFQQGLNIANEKDDELAVQTIVSSIADEVGVAAAMRRVEEKAANDNRWRLVAAQLCRSQGDNANALKWVQKVLDDPKIAGRERDQVMGLAGELYCNLSPPDFAKATEIFKKLVANDPENVSALNNLAAVMTMPGSPSRPEDALQYSEKAYNIMNRAGDSEAAVLDTHGAILVQVGRIDEGIGLLQSAIERRPIPDAYYHLGDAYLKQSKPDEAEAALRQAHELIARAERDKAPVDPTLRARVEEALIRASALKQQKTSGAQ